MMHEYEKKTKSEKKIIEWLDGYSIIMIITFYSFRRVDHVEKGFVGTWCLFLRNPPRILSIIITTCILLSTGLRVIWVIMAYHLALMILAEIVIVTAFGQELSKYQERYFATFFCERSVEGLPTCS